VIFVISTLKLGLDSLTHELCNFTYLLFRYPSLGTVTVTSLTYEKHDCHFFLMIKIQNIIRDNWNSLSDTEKTESNQ